ncbi:MULTISPECIES: hypothetical protein [Ralstonia]|uniref:Uncharacterized protein n=2 Tax=Ralstonia pickettii TaxID=329 RepID=R0DWL4_RALPI|nr:MULTISPECIES: hypothetical protein [Ralstonia]ENZ77823.1 hypothetical protein OR214_02099 [Ralstonia pickettii OR214]MCM3582076.1 hypothetical protein [Ralstonia pickettii]
MSNVLLFRKVADGLDVALPATQDPPQCMHIGVSGGRMTKHAVEGYTQIALQEQLGAIGFELLGERAFDEASVVETVPSDVLFVVLGVNESAFRKSVAGLVGGEPDWSFVDHHEEMFVVGTRASNQTVIGILGAAIKSGLEVAKPCSTSDELDLVPVRKSGKEMLSFFGSDLFFGALHGASVKAGLVVSPTVFSVGRPLVNF